MLVEITKLKTLNKLIDNGINTEKKITALDLQKILAVPGITVPEIHIITELQNAIKGRKVITYLSDGTDEESIPEPPDEEAEAAESEDDLYGEYNY